jgi:cell division protein FtsL
MGKFRFIGKLLRELVDFAREEKVYWIAPLVIVLLIVSVLIVATQTSAPFIYTIF